MKAPQSLSSPAEIFSQEKNTPMTHLNNKKQHIRLLSAKEGCRNLSFRVWRSIQSRQTLKLYSGFMGHYLPPYQSILVWLGLNSLGVIHLSSHFLLGQQTKVLWKRVPGIKYKKKKRGKAHTTIKPSCWYKEKTYNIVPSELHHGQMTYLY